MTPDTFQSYRLDDLHLALKGWENRLMFEKHLVGKSTAILGLIIGKGFNMTGDIVSGIHAEFGIKPDKPGHVGPMTPDKITSLIDRYNEHQRQKRLKKDSDG